MASFSVVSNIASANAQSNLQSTNMGLNKALSRLSSGFRINSSGDDAAGLAVANTYRNDVAIMNQGIRNANDGLSKLQIKDSALANIATILDRMATLATQAASESSGVDVAKLAEEFETLTEEIDRESAVAELATTADFSVFVSSESTVSNGGVSGTHRRRHDRRPRHHAKSPSPTRRRRRPCSRRCRERSARSATCRTPSARCRTA